jgi:hypothetical protein
MTANDPHWNSTTITRAQNRRGMMTNPRQITDAYEIDVEDRFRSYLLALPPGTRITEGITHIWDWVTATCGCEITDDECDLHSHLTVLLMTVVKELGKRGFLECADPVAHETEFVRTGKQT